MCVGGQKDGKKTAPFGAALSEKGNLCKTICAATSQRWTILMEI